MNLPNEKAVTQAGISLWANGGARPSSSLRSGVVTNPATGNVIRHVPFANAQDIDFAVRAASAALPGWRKKISATTKNDKLETVTAIASATLSGSSPPESSQGLA